MVKRRDIGPKSVPGGQLSAGIGYVIVPADQDRDIYISQCFSTGTIMVLVEDQDYVSDIKIDVHRLQFITFPDTPEELGSCVAWVSSPVFKKPIVVSIITKGDDFVDVVENQFKFRRETDNAYAEISARGDKGQMFFSVDSDEEDGGRLNVLVKNRSNKGELNLLVKGNVNLESTDNFNIKSANSFNISIKNPLDDNETITEISYHRDEGFSYKDQYENEISINDGQITTKSEKIVQNEGGNQAVLGNQLKGYEEDKLTEFDTHTHPTALGPSGPPTKPLTPIFKPQIPNWLSSIFSFD